MANLQHEIRQNPATGKREAYFRIAFREGGKQKKEALGYLTQREAEVAMKRWEAMRTLGLRVSPPASEQPSS